MVIFILLGMIVLLSAGIPIGIALGVISLVYFTVEGIPLGVMVQQAFSGANSFVLVAIPLFMLASQLMNTGGLSRRLVRFCNSLVGHLRGGLAHVNIVASMIFAGMQGSALADVSSIGTILIPSMVEEGYDEDFTSAVTAASSVIGPIIPPSIPMVLTGSLTGVSVARLFFGGAIPGILFGVFQMVVAYLISVRRNYPRQERTSFRDLLFSFKESLFGLLTPVVILGGILSGVFTPTEAAVIAVVYSFVVGLFIYRELGLLDSLKICYNVMVSTGGIMFVVALANLYSYILTREKLPEIAAHFLFSISTNPLVILFAVIIALLILGCFLSTTPALLLSIPVLLPLAKQIGYDPVYFFVIVTITLCLGTLTPPVGLALYLCSSIAKIPPERTFMAMLPLLAVMILVLVIATLYPPTVLWLPNLLFK